MNNSNTINDDTTASPYNNSSGINEKITLNLKSTLQQLKSDIASAFDDVKSSSTIKKIEDGSDNIHSNTPKRGHNTQQAYNLSEYLFNIKNKQLEHINEEYEFSNRSIAEVTKLFIDSIDKKPTLQNTLDKVMDILHSKYAIIWQQQGDKYRLRTCMLTLAEGEEVLKDVIPLLALKNDAHTYFQSNDEYYMAHTNTNSSNDTIAIIFASKYKKNYLKSELEIGIQLSKILFELAYRQ